MKEKNQAGILTPFQSRLTVRSAIETVRCWQKKNRNYTHKYAELTFDEEERPLSGGSSLFSRRYQIHQSSTCKNKQRKWIIELNVKCKTIELLGDNIGESGDNFNFGDDFFRHTTKALSIKEKN